MSHKRRLNNNHSLGGKLNVVWRASETVVDRVVKVRRMRREFLELSAMSSIELQDIGIGREDIFAVVSGSYDAGRHRS